MKEGTKEKLLKDNSAERKLLTYSPFKVLLKNVSAYKQGAERQM